MTKRKSPPGLSARERQCLTLAARGLTAKEISREIGSVTDQTVETYLKRGREKLGVSSSVLAGRLLEDGGQSCPPKLDVPPKIVVSLEEHATLGSSEAAVEDLTTSPTAVRDEHEAYRLSPPTSPLAKWMPVRREGGQDNELSFNAVLGWALGLPFAGAVLLLIVAVAVAAVGLIWGGSINQHLK